MSSFITFEGTEGCGKSTQIDLLGSHLKKLGIPFVVTREPGGTELGESIRKIVHSKKFDNMDFMTETLLYMASRSQHITEVISPALQEGKIVICDRFIDSTIAYQGFARGLPTELLSSLNSIVCKSIYPTITFLLDISPHIGIQRKWASHQEKKSELNRIDELDLQFHKKVRAGYLQLAKEQPHRWRVINAQKPISLVHKEIITSIETLINSTS